MLAGVCNVFGVLDFVKIKICKIKYFLYERPRVYIEFGALGKNSTDDILKSFPYFFRENRLCQSMQIVF